MSAYERRTYKGNVAYTVTLASDIGGADLSIPLSDGSTFPDGSAGPFTITIDPNGSGEEKVQIESRSGNTLTVPTGGRGYDGTSAASHSSGVKVVHSLSAVDLDEANQAVVQTIGKVAAAGDQLVGSGANALQKVAAIAKGGLWVSTGVGAAPVWLPVGSNGQVLTADSTQTDGVKWAAVPAPTLAQVEALFTADKQILSGTGSGSAELIDLLSALLEEFTATGQLIVGTGSGTGELLDNGTTGQVLTATTGSPPAWAPPAASAFSSAAGSLGGNVSLPAGTTSVFSTSSLATGTWLIDAAVTLAFGGNIGTAVLELEAIAGTATASFTGQQSAMYSMSAGSAASDRRTMGLRFIATVTGAGTVTVRLTNSGGAGTSVTALAATDATSYPHATGYTAVKLA